VKPDQEAPLYSDSLRVAAWVVRHVAAFFYSIRRSDVQALMQRAFPEPPVGRLIGAILASGEGLIGRAEAAWLGWPNPPGDGCGLPIGNLTSQWWGNVILDGLDHHAQRTLRIPAYQRYMDDMLLFSDSRAQLEDARDALGAWLLGERGLRLKDPAAPVTSTRRPRVVLGYRLDRDGFVIADKARQRARQRLRVGTLDGPGLTATAACWMFGA
jgi:hypothetical protein